MSAEKTFENFVALKSNQVARTVAQMVCEEPGAATHNPFYLFGAVGLGKTHLLQAIGHCLAQNRPALKTLYVPVEQFTNELVNGIGRGEMAKFRDKYRSLDLWLLDDLQFMGGKPSTQEEFFHTFNTLKEAGKQIVIGADRAPSAIYGLEERLRSRLLGGVVAKLEPPTKEERLLILDEKIKSRLVKLDSAVVALLAETIQTNFRDLEGGLYSLLAYSEAAKTDLTMETAAKILRNLNFVKEPGEVERA